MQDGDKPEDSKNDAPEQTENNIGGLVGHDLGGAEIGASNLRTGRWWRSRGRERYLFLSRV